MTRLNSNAATRLNIYSTTKNHIFGEIIMKIQSRVNHIIGLFLLLFISSIFAVAQPAPLQGFDDYVNKSIKDWEVPGVAIAVVKDDKIVFAKGYGVRELGKPTPVDERTLFA